MKFVFILKLFTAPIKQLLEILSRCPLYLNQGPAIEIWSVVHFPCALINNLASLIYLPIGKKGSKSCNLSDFGLTETISLLPSNSGSIYPESSQSNPSLGNSTPTGGSSITSSPNSLINLSFVGSKSNLPAIAIAATISG